MRALAVHPNDQSIVFAGTIDGIYRSDDDGRTWTRSSDGLGNRVARTIAINPGRTDEMVAWVWGEEELFRSVDGGESWSSLEFGEYNDLAFLRFSRTPFVLYTAVDQILYSSDDGGETWVEMAGVPARVQDMAILQDQSRNMAVALTPDGAMVTSDGGTSWRDCGDTDEGLERILFDSSFSSLIYGYRSDTLYRSADGCRSWSSDTDSRINGSTFLVAHPHNTQTLYAGASEEVLVTRNGGRSWRRFGPGGGDLRSFDMGFSPTSAFVFFIAGEMNDEDRGVFRSEDNGVSWQIDSTGLTATGVGQVALDSIDPTVAYAGSYLFGSYSGNGVFKTWDSGESWAFLDGTEGAGPVLATDPQSPNTVYATSADWSLLKSSNGGETWSNVWEGWSGRRIGQIEVDHHRAGTVFAVVSEHYNEVHRSNDGGRSWNELTLPDANEVYEVFSDPGNVGVVFASTEIGPFRSSNWGASWVHAADGLETSEDCRPWCGDYHSISDIAFDPVDADVVYVATEVGPYRSIDRGLSWELAREGMLICCEMQVWSDECDLRLKTSGPPVCEGWPLDLAADPVRPYAIYATTSFGTYRSLNRGESWWLTAEPLDSSVQTIEAPGDGVLIGTSPSAGVVRLTTGRMPTQRSVGHRTPTRQPSRTGTGRPEKEP